MVKLIKFKKYYIYLSFQFHILYNYILKNKVYCQILIIFMQNFIRSDRKHLNRGIYFIIKQAIKYFNTDKRRSKRFIRQHLRYTNPSLQQMRGYFKNDQIRQIIQNMLQQKLIKHFINLIKKRSNNGIVKYTMLKYHSIIKKQLIKYYKQLPQNNLELQQRVRQGQEYPRSQSENSNRQDQIKGYKASTTPIPQSHNIDNSNCKQNIQSYLFYTHDISNHVSQVQLKDQLSQEIDDLLNLDIQYQKWSKYIQISMQLIDNPQIEQQPNIFNQLLSQTESNIQLNNQEDSQCIGTRQQRTQLFIDSSFQFIKDNKFDSSMGQQADFI